MRLAELIHQDQFISEAQEAIFQVVVTGSWIMGELAQTMAPYGVTPAQYNVLRILRGSHPDTLTCTTIGSRLLDRTPDVTRLLDRLDRRGLIHRERAERDRRVVEVSITEKGLALLAEMRDAVEGTMGRLTQYLEPGEDRMLSSLLERMRTDQ